MEKENIITIFLAPLPSADVNVVRSTIADYLAQNWFLGESFLNLQEDGLLKFIVHQNADSQDMRNIEIILSDGGYDNPSRPQVLATQINKALRPWKISNIKADIHPRSQPIHNCD